MRALYHSSVLRNNMHFVNASWKSKNLLISARKMTEAPHSTSYPPNNLDSWRGNLHQSVRVTRFELLWIRTSKSHQQGSGRSGFQGCWCRMRRVEWMGLRPGRESVHRAFLLRRKLRKPLLGAQHSGIHISYPSSAFVVLWYKLNLLGCAAPDMDFTQRNKFTSCMYAELRSKKFWGSQTALSMQREQHWRLAFDTVTAHAERCQVSIVLLNAALVHPTNT